MKVELAAQGSPSLIILMVSADVKQHLKKKEDDDDDDDDEACGRAL